MDILDVREVSSWWPVLDPILWSRLSSPALAIVLAAACVWAPLDMAAACVCEPLALPAACDDLVPLPLAASCVWEPLPGSSTILSNWKISPGIVSAEEAWASNGAAAPGSSGPKLRRRRMSWSAWSLNFSKLETGVSSRLGAEPKKDFYTCKFILFCRYTKKKPHTNTHSFILTFQCEHHLNQTVPNQIFLLLTQSCQLYFFFLLGSKPLSINALFVGILQYLISLFICPHSVCPSLGSWLKKDGVAFYMSRHSCNQQRHLLHRPAKKGRISKGWARWQIPGYSLIWIKSAIYFWALKGWRLYLIN